MNNFLLYSVVGSVVLTLLLNFLPMLFPNAANKLQHKIEENARRSIEHHEDESRGRVKVFFPWKAMLIGSIILTIVMNFTSWFGR